MFGPFSQFSGQKVFFSGKRITSHRFLAPCRNLGKTNDTIPRKRLDRRRTEGLTEGQTDPTLLHTSRYRRGPKTSDGFQLLVAL